jgi:hypothetical protein
MKNTINMDSKIGERSYNPTARWSDSSIVIMKNTINMDSKMGSVAIIWQPVGPTVR